MLKEVQIREKNRKKYIEAKTAETELEDDSEYVDMFASSVSFHRATADRCTETWMEIVPNLQFSNEL